MQTKVGKGVGPVAEPSVWAYISNIKHFTKTDWLRYIVWIGTISSLLLGTSSFVLWGHWQGVVWPGYVWFIPLGTAIFVAAIAIDDIGHRTLYKAELAKGEAYVHHMIIATAIPSVVTLCLCYEHGEAFQTPALVLILLSLFYTAVDEVLHWVRYLKLGVDRVEMWSHFHIIVGHSLMIASWWQWFKAGYPGVKETLLSLPWL